MKPYDELTDEEKKYTDEGPHLENESKGSIVELRRSSDKCKVLFRIVKPYIINGKIRISSTHDIAKINLEQETTESALYLNLTDIDYYIENNKRPPKTFKEIKRDLANFFSLLTGFTGKDRELVKIVRRLMIIIKSKDPSKQVQLQPVITASTVSDIFKTFDNIIK